MSELDKLKKELAEIKRKKKEKEEIARLKKEIAKERFDSTKTGKFFKGVEGAGKKFLSPPKNSKKKKVKSVDEVMKDIDKAMGF